MKKRYGFTLIELLAVIIVLAIIALIAMPIIFNVIENAKLKSMENSAYGVVDAVRLYYMENLMNTDNGEVPLNGSVTTLTLSGEHPTGGTWEIDNEANSEDVGIKISGVTFASMEGYVCDSEETEQGELTGKVVCLKDNIAFTVSNDAINENGWAKEDINVKVTAEGVSNLKYCIDDEKCTPNQDVPSSGINVTTEGSNYLCVKGDNTKVRCNIYNLDKTTPNLTVKTSNPMVTEGQSNEISTYLNEPTYGPSSGNIVCKDENDNEITNTNVLAVGTHTITCNAVGNNGKSSSNAVITVKVEEKLTRLAVDADGDGVAELGDEVCIGNECFYVLTNDGTNIRMLAKYRIDVSDNTTRKDRLQNTGTMTTGFASDSIHGTNYSSYEGSIVEDLVGDYKTTLEGLGATISDATLLTYDEIISEPFACSGATKCDSAYSWIYRDGNTTGYTHWTKTSFNYIFVWYVSNVGYAERNHCMETRGVRPVVTIPSSSL